VARKRQVVSEPLGIVELAGVCARQQAIGLNLFEVLGGWATDTDDGALQRLFLTACHRHAWHAQLWGERAPAIPPVDIAVATAAHRASHAVLDNDIDRIGWYRVQLDSLQAELAATSSRVDAVLDPSTARVVALVSSDLWELSTLATR
jgi:hypothetical protein